MLTFSDELEVLQKMADKAEKEEKSVLESLYELWINRDPVCDEEVRELYRQLEECMAELTVVESDRISGIIADLCVAYSKGAFLDGAKMGGALIHEILFEK